MVNKKAYDLWDMPPEVQVKTPPAPLAPEPRVRKKPGPKPRVQPIPVAPVVVEQPDKSLIQQLVGELRKLLVKVEIRDPKPRIAAPNSPPVAYISNIVLGGVRIGYLEQLIDSNRVYLKFEKGQNIPIFHAGDAPDIIAEKIQQEIEKHYTKRLAAQVGYRTAIRVAAHRRRM